MVKCRKVTHGCEFNFPALKPKRAAERLRFSATKKADRVKARLFTGTVIPNFSLGGAKSRRLAPTLMNS
jgi:hypothetical protein